MIKKCSFPCKNKVLSPGVGVGEGRTNVVAPGVAVCDRCVRGVT